KVNTFIASYENKLKKINSGNYSIFDENNLFLFCDDYTEKEITSALDFLKFNEYDNFETKYNFIYAYTIQFIYVINSDFTIIKKMDII
ncbi:MAG: hypothetical protein ACRC5M_00415, partial [Anaeroplasmataceae bacterium]